jgi:hypothetical protein
VYTEKNPIRDKKEMVGDFFREVAALVVVFAFLDKVIFDKPITLPVHGCNCCPLRNPPCIWSIPGKEKKSLSEYWPFIVLFAFSTILYIGTILWTEVFFPEQDRAISPQVSIEEERTRIHEQLAQFLSTIQPGLFDKIEDQEKKKSTLTPAFRR